MGCKTELLLLMGSSRTAVSFSPWIHRSGSQAVGLLPWIRGGGQVIHVSLVSTLLSWVVISQVGIENPKVLINLQISRGIRCVDTRKLSRHLLRSCGHRRGYIDGPRVISSGVSSVFGSDSDILSIFGSGSGILG